MAHTSTELKLMEIKKKHQESQAKHAREKNQQEAIAGAIKNGIQVALGAHESSMASMLNGIYKYQQ